MTEVADTGTALVCVTASSAGEPGGGEEVADEAPLAVVDLEGARCLGCLAFAFSLGWLGRRGIGSLAV